MVDLKPIFSTKGKEGNSCITLSLEKQHEERELWLTYCVLSVHFVSESVAHKHPKAKEKGVSESV